jgi:hypothetical protein
MIIKRDANRAVLHILLGTLAFALLFFQYRATLTALSLKGELASLKAESQRAEAELRREKSLTASYEDILIRMKRALPEAADSEALFYSAFDSLLVKEGLSDVTLKTVSGLSGPLIVRASGEADYVSLLRFTAGLEMAPFLLNIEDISITPSRSASEMAAYSMAVRLYGTESKK